MTARTTFGTVPGLMGALAIAIVIGGAAPRTEQALDITVRPNVTTAPAAVLIVARVEPHEDNRTLVVRAETPHYYRASHVQLEGADAARTHSLLLKNLPAGIYIVTVTLEGTGGIRALDRGVVEVMG